MRGVLKILVPLLTGLITIAVMVILVSRYIRRGSVEPTRSGCTVPVDRIDYCERIDDGFQDSSGYDVVWGRPRRALCDIFVHGAKPPAAVAADKAPLCAWDDPKVWREVSCKGYRAPTAWRCWKCDAQWAGDERMERFVGYTDDCETGVVLSLTGGHVIADVIDRSSPAKRPSPPR